MKKILLALLMVLCTTGFANAEVRDSVQEPHVNIKVIKMPVGVVIAVQKEWLDCAKAGWLPCNGAKYDIEEYPKLNELLADRYGTGILPNFQGTFLRGYKKNVSEEYGRMQTALVRNKIQNGTYFETLTTSAANPANATGGWKATTLSSPAGTVKAKNVSNSTNSVWEHLGESAVFNFWSPAGGMLFGAISGIFTKTKTYYIGADSKITLSFKDTSLEAKEVLEEAKQGREAARKSGASYQSKSSANWCDAHGVYYEKTGNDLYHNVSEWNELIRNIEAYMNSAAYKKEVEKNSADAMQPTNYSTYYYIKAK